MESAPIKLHTQNLLRGFTLLEMVVVTAIIGILLAVVLTSERNFDNSTVLINSVYDLALTIRETQSMGLSSRAFSTYNNVGYGLDFADASGAVTVTQFADTYPAIPNEASPTTACIHNTWDVGTPAERPGNCIYDSGSTPSEKVTQFMFNSGYKIGNIQYLRGVNNNSLVNGQSIDIYFYRPNLQAVITANSGSSHQIASAATISVVSPAGSKRCVQVNTLGEITILPTTTSCP